MINSNTQLELSVLYTLLVATPDDYFRMLESLDFSEEMHRTAFNALKIGYETGCLTDIYHKVEVVSLLEQGGVMLPDQFLDYLIVHGEVAGTVSVKGAMGLRGYRQQRQIRAIANRMLAMVEANKPITDILGFATDKLSIVSSRTRLDGATLTDSVLALSESLVDVRETEKRKGRDSVVSFRMPTLDDKLYLQRFMAGQFIILAGTPSAGKTALALQLCVDNSTAGVATGIISLEMGREQLASRVLQQLGEVPTSWLKYERESGETIERRAISVAEICRKIPLHIVDDAYTLHDIEAATNQLCGAGAELIVVDYLQLAARNSLGKGSVMEAVMAISSLMKRLARKHKIPVIGVSQLTTGEKEQQGDFRTFKMRWAGELQQDADAIYILEDMDGTDVKLRRTMLSCQKQRAGARYWSQMLVFDTSAQRFSVAQTK